MYAICSTVWQRICGCLQAALLTKGSRMGIITPSLPRFHLLDVLYATMWGLVCCIWCICTGRLNSSLSLLSVLISAAKVRIWSHFSVRCLGLNAPFPICLSLARAVPRQMKLSQKCSKWLVFLSKCFCYFTLIVNLAAFCSCLCRWRVYLFLLFPWLNLRVEAATVCRKVTVALGLVCASYRRVPALNFWHRPVRRPFCSNSWLLACTAGKLPPCILGLLQPTDTHLETLFTFHCGHLVWLRLALDSFWLAHEWHLYLWCVLKSSEK